MKITEKIFDKKKFLQFWQWLNKQKRLKINFFLLLGLISLTPTQNYYSKLEIQPGRPVLRQTDLEVEKISDYPVNVTNKNAPRISASSVLIVDKDSKAIIFQKNPDLQLFPASITKIMTALVVLDNYQLDKEITVEESYKVGMIMGLEKGEIVTVRSLLKGMLIGSANDAAITLARQDANGIIGFVEKMNQKAEELNLENTHFTNPIGLDEQGHKTTVHDLMVLTDIALDNELFKQLVGIKRVIIKSNGIGDTEKQYNLENINQLLGNIKGLKGVKTGWTQYAGECLVSWTERDAHGILVVVLGSADRFGETQLLTEWVFENFEWEAIDTTLQ